MKDSAASDDLRGSSHSTIKIDSIAGFIKSISLEREDSAKADSFVPIKIREETIVQLLQL